MPDQQENTALSREDTQAENTPNTDNQGSSGQGSSTDQAQGGQDNQGSSKDQNQDGSKPETSSDSSQATDTQDSSGDTDQADAADDELATEDLDALDAKVRRKVSKVNRENSNLRDRLATAEQNTLKATQRADRAEAALAAGLPHSALKYLNGDTAEELEANAEELLVLLGYGQRVTPSSLPRQVGGYQSAAGSQVEDLDSIGSRIFKN